MKKLKLVKNFLTNRPLFCSWQVTYCCNFKCNFCDYWKIKPNPKDELSLENIEIASKKLARIGSLIISVAGGEPLLRNDLPEIIKILSKDHFPVITTNGFLVKEDIAKKLFKNGLLGVSVSIDYNDSKTHDQMRGVSGAFDNAIKALEIFSRQRTNKNQHVNILSVLKDDNLQHTEELIKLAQKYSASFMTQPYCSLKTGRGIFDKNQDFMPSRKLLELKKKYKNFKSSYNFLSLFDKYIERGIPNCRAGVSFFNIDNYGNIAKCVEDMGNPIGNILTIPTKKIVPLLKDKNKTNTCQNCWYNCRGETELLYTFKGFCEGVLKLF